MLCPKCQKEVAENATFCEFCGATLAPTSQPAPSAPVEKEESIVAGTVGAFIGALLGALSIILLDRLGFVASISGFILAYCTFYGYKLLGHRLSTAGILICTVLIAATPYLADRACWAMVVMEAYKAEGVTFMTAFMAVPALIEEGAIESGAYIKSLLMLYGFTALGAFSIIRDKFKQNKKAQ